MKRTYVNNFVTDDTKGGLISILSIFLVGKYSGVRVVIWHIKLSEIKPPLPFFCVYCTLNL